MTERMWHCRASFHAAGAVHHREQSDQQPEAAVRIMAQDVTRETADPNPRLLRLTAHNLPAKP